MCEMPDFYHEADRVARDCRRCEVCGMVVAAGSRYVAATGKWDGEVETIAMHPECKALYEVCSDFDRYDCLAFQEVREFVSETRFDRARRGPTRCRVVRSLYASILRKYRRVQWVPRHRFLIATAGAR